MFGIALRVLGLKDFRRSRFRLAGVTSFLDDWVPEVQR